MRDVTPQVVVAWRRNLMKNGGVKNGKALAPATVRRARAPLPGAMKRAIEMGVVAVNPLTSTSSPRTRRWV